jgi:hypothetical protein
MFEITHVFLIICMGSAKSLFNKKYININSVTVNGRQIVFRFSCSRRLQKYFSSNTFYIEYDTAINNVSKSLLTIPAVSVLVPIAWATGANLYVEELDETYLRSLEKIKAVTKKWHPNFSFHSEVKAQKEIPNKFQNKDYGLLFSGGLDSTVSYIQNKVLKPHLISIWGVEVLTQNTTLWKKAKSTLTEFANKEHIPIHFIKSDFLKLLNDSLLSIEFGRNWWVRVTHGLTMISLCAPLTMKSFGTILIASSRGVQHPDEIRYPLGSSPLIDEKISWADVKVIHDCHKLSRQQKIKHVLKQFTETEYHPILRVCTNAVRQELNCSQCHKCLNTMTGLVLEGIDPNKCGFKMTDKTLTTLKKSFLNGEYKIFEHDFVSPNFIWRTDEWKTIQTEIPPSLNHNLYNSGQFFNWLREFDLEKYGTEMEQRMSNQRLRAVLKWRLLGCALAIMSFLPKALQNEAKRVFTSYLNLVKTSQQIN